MAKGRISASDITTLQMALVGYEYEKQKIDMKIRELTAQLKGKKAPVGTGGAEPQSSPRAKRVLSPDARRRIAQAQKKRWAEHRKRVAAEGKQGKGE
jgi:hypothetical protein